MKNFIDRFKEGCTRRISNFDHALNINGGYRCAKHEYKIVFEPNTLVEYVADFDTPNHVFEIAPFAEITNFVAKFDYYFDVIGVIIGYSGPVAEEGKKRITVELEHERADRLKITLWGEYANRITNLMSTDVPYPVVLIVQYVNCKKYYGSSNLLAYRMEEDQIKEASIHKISIMSSISGYTTLEDFVNGALFLSLNEIKEIEEEYDWSYIGCRDCNRKVVDVEDVDAPRTVNKFSIGANGVKHPIFPRSGCAVYVRDDSASRIVTLRDRHVYNFIHKTATELREKDIDAELSAEFAHNITPTQYNTAKTGASYIDETDIGLPGDDTADSPPPKKSKEINEGNQSHFLTIVSSELGEVVFMTSVALSFCFATDENHVAFHGDSPSEGNELVLHSSFGMPSLLCRPIKEERMDLDYLCDRELVQESYDQDDENVINFGVQTKGDDDLMEISAQEYQGSLTLCAP
ncbi:OLC1v1008000C1 [Oldenlandia corymbosa var. corymbosa]|uniref:OLC1v1008000C1 n=1 Tax=Oldenlandia corymbosa var. corymbosa TaxID=529605 RepID=A0AAV1DKN0_OLDCO|nr:OLC1v1008000C1 [Oldenlandia corymbosa var. corymbosa]